MTNHASRRRAPAAKPPAAAAATLRSAGEIPPGLRSVPAAEMTPEAEAAMALQMQQDRQRESHDNLAAMLAGDPALLLQKLPEIYGKTVADMITQGFMQVLEALGALPVKAAGRYCETCLGARIEWNDKHADALEMAKALFMKQAGVSDPVDPRLAQADLTAFLPESLQPGAEPDGLPPVHESVTTAGGSDVCPAHHPAALKAAEAAGMLNGRKRFLIANMPLNAAMIREAGGIPGVFGGLS